MGCALMPSKGPRRTYLYSKNVVIQENTFNLIQNVLFQNLVSLKTSERTSVEVRLP